MSAVTLLSFIQGIVADLKTELLPFGVKDVATHYGMFNEVAVGRFGAKAPAARVAAIAVQKIPPYQGELHADVRFAVYLVTRDSAVANQPGVPRDVAMLGLVQAVIQRANANGWGGAAGDQPVDIAAENLYADDQAGAGYLLWAVSFTQGVNCDITDITQLANFTTLTDTIEDPDTEETVIADTGPVNP